MSQSVASRKWLNPRTALASAALLVIFDAVDCNGMDMGTSSTSSTVKVTNGTLTDQHSMALYMSDRDAMAGKSTCNGKCAENWPSPAANDADKPSGDYTIITRDDGRKRWTYRSKPLYPWAKDKMPDNQTGDGFMDVWYIAKS